MLDVFVLATVPETSVNWSPEQRLNRWARVMDWHDYARGLNADGKLPWAWGLRQTPHSHKTSTVAHGVAAIYHVTDLAEFTALADDDPLREVSDYLTVPLATLKGDFATDAARLEDARRLLVGENATAMLRYAEYEATMAKKPDFVGKWRQTIPLNEPVDFDRLEEPGDKLQFLVNGVNPHGYFNWDDMRHLMHYQKVMWWHHYTWMLAAQGIKTHTWGTHDYCTTVNGGKYAAAFDVFSVPSMEAMTEALALDPIRFDSILQIAPLRVIAEQRRSDERRATQAIRQAGHTGLIRARRLTRV